MTIGNDQGAVMGPLLIFQNPHSGDRDLQEVRQTIESQTRGMGHDAEFLLHRAGSSLAQTLNGAFERASQCNGRVVVAGGDGTINVAASIAVERGQALGIIPTGTFNFVARSHGIPEDTAEAVKVLLHERPRATRVGRVNEQLFLVNASIGSYARLQQEREGFKRTIGRSRSVASLAAVVSALKPSPMMQLELNHQGRVQRVNCSTLILCNSRLQLELVGVDTLPGVNADELACIALSAVDVATQLSMIWKGWQRQISDADEVQSFVFDDLTITVPKRRSVVLKAAVDGEMHRLRLPLRVSVSPRPLWLIRPSAEGEVSTA